MRGRAVILAISPHLDDVLLSAGAWLSWHPGAHIVTVFAGDPDDDIPITAWDSACGFSSGRHAMGVRRHEDKRAAGEIDATVQHLPLADGQYRDEIAYEEGVLEQTIATIVTELRPATVLVPLGIVHSDHRAVGDACRRALAHYTAGDVVAYEDLPYRVDSPAAAVHTLDDLEVEWYAPDLCPDDVAAIGAKARAVTHYVSQIWAIPRWSIYVPERLWRLRLEEVDGCDGE
jgi:LmbE family N-acetylglucosaminyl deacetylase